jgi:hypothetical protein
VREQERADVEALADVERARQRESLAARGEAAKESRFLDEAAKQVVTAAALYIS